MFGFFCKLFEPRQGDPDDHSVKKIKQNAFSLDKAEKGNSSWLPPGAVIDMPTNGKVGEEKIESLSHNRSNENGDEVAITINNTR